LAFSHLICKIFPGPLFWIWFAPVFSHRSMWTQFSGFVWLPLCFQWQVPSTAPAESEGCTVQVVECVSLRPVDCGTTTSVQGSKWECGWRAKKSFVERTSASFPNWWGRSTFFFLYVSGYWFLSLVGNSWYSQERRDISVLYSVGFFNVCMHLSLSSPPSTPRALHMLV
jgi:hypothetical protein